MDAAVSTKTEDTMRVDEEKARIISAFYDTAVSPCTLWISPFLRLGCIGRGTEPARTPVSRN